MKVALIGHGMWGANLARNFHELGALALVCDPGEGAQALVRERYPSVDVVGELDAVWNRSDIGAVAIATPAETHYHVAMAALEAGKDVFVEKPLSLRVEEGERLVAKAKEKGLILMVGHLMEYHPAVEKIRQMVQDGTLGKVQYIYSNRLNWGKVRREENILWSFAPHDIAIILAMLGEMPSRVFANGGNYLQPHIADVTVTTMDFDSGVRSHIFVSWLHPYKEQRLVVIGDRMVACFDDMAQGAKLTLYPHSIEWVDRVPLAKKGIGEAVEFDSVEPLRVECQAYLSAIETRVPPRTDGESGVRVLRVLEDCQAALEHGQASAESTAIPSAEDPKSAGMMVHASAHVDEGAEVGEGTRIWHGAHVMKGAQIGRDCVLSQNVFVAPGVRIGDRVKLQNNVSVYDGVVLENDVFCGPSMVFTNVRNPRAHVERKDAFEETRVGRGATLGANSTIRCGVTIGSHALVGAGAVVTKDVPANRVVVGNPARAIGWACACGEVLPLGAEQTEGEALCARCETSYRLRANVLETT